MMAADVSVDRSQKLKRKVFEVAEDSQVGAAVSYALFVLLVGIPLWWKTTTVYRVALPYGDIHDLQNLKINLPVHVTVVVFDDNVSVPELALARSALEQIVIDDVSEDNLDVTFVWDVRFRFEEELHIFQSSADADEMDFKLYSSKLLPDVAVLKVALLPPGSAFVAGGTKFYVGRHRAIFAVLNGSLQQTCVSDVFHAVTAVINPSSLRRIYSSVSGLKKELPDKMLMRTLPSTSEVDVTFTLILPEASHVVLHWDIERATIDYLQPFEKKIHEIVSLKVKSQVFYLMFLDIRAHYHSERKHYMLGADRLPHIVNPVEAKLGSYVSTNPSLNFVVYVPADGVSPLQVYEDDGTPSALNSFLIPRWGGFLVQNVDRRDLSSGNATLDMRRVMGIFVAQLRLMLGIPNALSSSVLSSASFDATYLHLWEVDNLMRTHVIENLVNAVSTLGSLAQLLEKIGNIVISDHVGEQVSRSLDAVFASCKALREGDLSAALAFSKEGFAASEDAFFDPSMLALLYFPEDQKYAVYVPLFLPISIPLLMSLRMVVAWYRHREKFD